MEELLANDCEHQHRLKQANEGLNHYLTEELKNADKKWKATTSKTFFHESKSDPSEMDQKDCNSDTVNLMFLRYQNKLINR